MKTTVEIPDQLLDEARGGWPVARGRRCGHSSRRACGASWRSGSEPVPSGSGKPRSRGMASSPRWPGVPWGSTSRDGVRGPGRVIAVDTNILVYAHREDAQWHDMAHGRLTELAEGRTPWAIPWPCLHEFLAIVTHPRIYAPPTPADTAIDQVDAWLESPSLTLLAESEGYWQDLRATLREGRIAGPQVHDGEGRGPLPSPRGPRAVDRRSGLRPVSRAHGPQSSRRLIAPHFHTQRSGARRRPADP